MKNLFNYRLMNATEGLGGDTPPVTPPPETPPAFVGPEWAKELKLEGLDNDVLTDPALKPITNVSSLLKSYVHAQRQVGKQGVKVPDQNSTQEEWDTFWQKAGVDLEEQKWAEKFKPAKELGLDEGLGKEYVKLAHQLRIHPEKAQKLYELFGNQSKAISEKFVSATKETAQAELDKYRDEIGQDAYNVKMAKATNMLKEHVGEDFVKFLGTSGLGKNANLVKAFVAMADKFTGEQQIESGNAPMNGMTLEEISKAINMHMADSKGPYLNSAHPDHRRTVDEVQKLFAMKDKNTRK